MHIGYNDFWWSGYGIRYHWAFDYKTTFTPDKEWFLYQISILVGLLLNLDMNITWVITIGVMLSKNTVGTVCTLILTCIHPCPGGSRCLRGRRRECGHCPGPRSAGDWQGKSSGERCDGNFITSLLARFITQLKVMSILCCNKITQWKT